MKLNAALLCDAAQVQGGKLFILGGGFDTIRARTFPVVHRNLTVAMVAEVEPEERHRDLELLITLIDEDGNEVGVEAKGKMKVGAPPNLPPGSSSIVPIVSPFYNVRFEEAKGYAFVIRYQDDELARITFRVVKVD